MTELNREFYVYVLYDPRNFQPFYIGEGKGNRMFSHESDPRDTRKTATILATMPVKPVWNAAMKKY